MATDDRLSKSVTLIKDLRPGMKNVTCVFIVIDKGSTNHTKDGSVVRKCRVADKSASVCFSLWNEQAAAIEGGDILKLTKGYSSLWKGAMVLYSGKYGHLEKTGEFNMVFSETPDMSDSNQEFIPRGNQQQPPPQNPSSGGRNLEPRGVAPPSATTRNDRMGTGPSTNPGNWNGNNHLSNGQQEAPPPSIADHVTHETGHSGNGYVPHPQQKLPLLGPDLNSRDNGSFHHRGPPHQNHHHHSNDRYHPYNRPLLANHNSDPRSSWR